MLVCEMPKASYFEQRSYDRRFWHQTKASFLDPLVPKIVTAFWPTVAGLPMVFAKRIYLAGRLMSEKGR
jgi:hypothetical protein